jgi:hypothetical protein
MKIPFPIKNTVAVARYGLHVLRKQRKPNWSLAEKSIQFAEDCGIWPQTIIDCGAHNSELGRWYQERWPAARLISFEPDLSCRPIGEVHRRRLGHARGIRFDELGLEFERPCLLKVDCDPDTANVLEGFGHWLFQVDLFVAEMFNNDPRVMGINWPDQQFRIWKLAMRHGFTQVRMVDVQLMTTGINQYDIAFCR